jgi:2-amino-4-hydroxy-6-hydroxymethyldihydropteridine diphosphokinase
MMNIPSSEPSEVYIALGANLGDREQTLMAAISMLDRHPKITVLRTSSIYETDPVGYEDQPAFLNMMIAAQTSLAPDALLAVLMETEQELGRVRDIRWGPRMIDLDMIVIHDHAFTWDSETLTLPHPRMSERLFVLIPLAEITPEGTLLAFVRESMGKLEGKEGVRRWKTVNWHSVSEHSAN